MTDFNIAILYDQPTSPPASASAVLMKAGYGVTSTIDVRQFRDELFKANCGLVLAHDGGAEVIPSPPHNIVVPPVVLVTNIIPDQLNRSLQKSALVALVLELPVTDRALTCAATQAVITNILHRVSYSASTRSELSELLRAGIHAVARGEQRRVTSVARELHVSTRTLEAHWSNTFGPLAPHLKDFCRGMWFLRLIRSAARDPKPSWSSIQKRQDIPRSTLRAAAIAFTGNVPSNLNLLTEPATIIARVCARSVPRSLRQWALGPGGT